MKTPVIVIGFNRPHVLERTLLALAQCYTVTERAILLYVDGARTQDEQSDIDAVINVAEKIRITLLPNLKIIVRKVNYGCQKNICSAIKEVLDAVGRMCLIEDDVLVSRTFLQYMDDALEFYQDDLRIFNVNGYKPRYLRIHSWYKSDVYLDLRNHTSGWGIWKDRWDRVRFGLDDWDMFKNDEDNLKKLSMAGYDLYSMIECQKLSPQLEAWDVQCTYHMVKNGMYSIAPRFSLTKNIGFGLESMHCKQYNPVMPTQKYYNFRPNLVRDIQTDKRILSQIPYVIQSPYILTRCIRKLHRGLLRFSPSFFKPLEIRQGTLAT